MYVFLLCETDEIFHALVQFVLLLLCMVSKAPLVDSFEDIFCRRAVQEPPSEGTRCLQGPWTRREGGGCLTDWLSGPAAGRDLS